MFTFFCSVEEHVEDANKMQEMDQELQIERTLQLGDTVVDNDTKVEGRMLALQEFHRVDHAPAEEDTEVADKTEETDGPLRERMQMTVVRAHFNKRCKETIRAWISRIIF